MTSDFDVVVERDSEGYYVASVPALHGCHTQARSLDVLMERVQEVVSLCMEEQGTVGLTVFALLLGGLGIVFLIGRVGVQA